MHIWEISGFPTCVIVIGIVHVYYFFSSAFANENACYDLFACGLGGSHINVCSVIIHPPSRK